MSGLADGLACMGSAFAAVTLLFTAWMRPRIRPSPRLADALGLTWTNPTRMRGEWNGVPVDILFDATTGLVRAPAPAGMRIVSVSQARALLTADRVHTGDLSLDNATLVNGPRDHLVAALDGAARVHVRELVVDMSFRGQVDGGWVTRRLSPRDLDVGSLSIILNTVTEVSRALHTEPTAERLAAIARADVWAGVRRNALEVLERLHPGVVVPVARDLLRDADLDVRLDAARLAGADGTAHLLVHLDDLESAVALDPGGVSRRLQSLPEDTLLGLLARADRLGRRAAARALGQVGTVHAVEAMLEAGFVDEARAIQARLGDVEAGRLSLAAGEAGQVALATDVGAVTVVEPSG
ncbi:MAG: hypothetical protein V4850_03325 [Myxococcota bacterium]